jgi:hypothetical protein
VSEKPPITCVMLPVVASLVDGGSNDDDGDVVVYIHSAIAHHPYGAFHV